MKNSDKENSSQNGNEQPLCFEEEIFLDGVEELLTYSLSNSLDEIIKAIYRRTGRTVNLDDAVWELNPYLSKHVRNLMKKHNVVYSMTTRFFGTYKNIIVNWRYCDEYFILNSVGLENKILTDEEIEEILRKIDSEEEN